MDRKAYPSDVSDEEWAFVAPYLTLIDPDAAQRKYPLREIFNALRWIVRAGAQWRMIPNDLPPWQMVYQQTRRWIDWGCFEAIVHDLRELIRIASDRNAQPSAAILDARTNQSTPESGAAGRAGYDAGKRRKGSKTHIAVDTLGHLLTLVVTPADEQERAQVAQLCERVQEATGGSVKVAFADQGYTGEDAAQAAGESGIVLEIVRKAEGQKGFVLLPKRWLVERSFGWLARFRRLARDYERLPRTVSGLTFLVFGVLMLSQAAKLAILPPLQIPGS